MEEIRMEIMLCLPLKSLFKFRSINKSWLATIDSSSFRKLHFQHRQSKNSFDDDEDSSYLQFFYSSNPFAKFTEVSIMHPDTGKSYNDFASYEDFIENNINGEGLGFSRPVHGLICLYRNNAFNPIALCNPFLREIKILPQSPSPCPRSYYRIIGIGYDDLKKDYKVVQLSQNYPQRCTVVEIYSKKENAWRVLGDHPFQKEYYISKPIQNIESRSKRSAAVVHFEGSRLWYTIEDVGKLENVIVSFDMRSEAFKTISIPIMKHEQIIEIFAKDDSFLMLICPFKKVDGCRVGELIMWEYKTTHWVKMWSFSPPFGSWVWPEAPWKRNGLILTVLCRKNNTKKEKKYIEKLGFYDCGSRQIIKYFELSDKYLYMNMVEYRGSFLSP